MAIARFIAACGAGKRIIKLFIMIKTARWIGRIMMKYKARKLFAILYARNAIRSLQLRIRRTDGRSSAVRIVKSCTGSIRRNTELRNYCIRACKSARSFFVQKNKELIAPYFMLCLILLFLLKVILYI